MSHVLEFEGARYNATGNLKIQGDAVQFQRDGSPTVQVNINSIQDILIIESFGWSATYKICRNRVR